MPDLLAVQKECNWLLKTYFSNVLKLSPLQGGKKNGLTEYSNHAFQNTSGVLVDVARSRDYTISIINMWKAVNAPPQCADTA